MLRRNSLFVLLSLALVSIWMMGCGSGNGGTIRISGTLPSSGTVNSSYGPSTLRANGGSGSYTWTTSGLPPGITVQGSLTSSSIKISGKPTTAGAFAASATVTDSKGNTVTYSVKITIAPSSSGPTVFTASLPGGTVGLAYSATLAATGGSTPYTWAQTSGGALPGGLMLTPSTGAITGTPTASGTFGPYVFTVTDAKNAMASSPALTIVIAAAASVTTTSLPNGTVGTAYPGMLAATGGTTPYTWTEKSGGNLPGGLSLTASSGAIAGTPTASGTFGPYVFTVTDANNKTADSPSLMITIMSSTTEAACAATPKSRGNEAALTTPFAFEANGAINGAGEPDSAAAWAGSFTPDGKGGISAADIDFVGTKDGHSSFQVQTIGSAYSYGSDGRGCLYLAFNGVNVDKADKLPIDGNASLLRGTGGLRRESVHAEGSLANVGTVTFSFALGENGVVGRIEQFDYINSAMVTAGLIMQQTPSDFAVSKLASHFAFGADGWASMDAQGDVVRVAIAGAMANSNGALSNSEADDNIGGVPSGKLSGSGSSGSLGTTISSTTGKGTGSYMIPDGGSTLTFNFTYYVINQSDFLFITTDSPSTVGALQLTGRALASTFGAVSLNGSYIPALQGIESGNNTLTIGTLAATSEGVISSATFYTNNGGSSQTQPFSNGGYAADGFGRVTFSKLQSNPPIAYLTNTASLDAIAAFMVGTDVDTASGFLALQTTNTPNFGQSSLMGSYAVGSFEDPSGMNGSNTGTATFDGKGGYTDLLDIVMFFEDASQPNVQGSGTVMSINADGSGTLGNGAQFVTNGTITLAIDGASLNKHPLGYIFIKQ